MLDYSLASKNIGKIFKGEIFTIISTVLLGISTIAAAIALLSASVSAEAGIVAGSITTVVLFIAYIVLAILAIVFKLGGMINGGRQNQNIKYALYFVLFSFALTIIAGIISTVSAATVWSNVARTVSTILQILVTVYILNGCSDFLTEKGNTELAEKAQTVLTRVIFAYVLAAICQFVPAFTPSVVDLIMAIAAIICEIIAYVQYLTILKKTQNALLA